MLEKRQRNAEKQKRWRRRNQIVLTAPVKAA
jgi:hypothetical protein